MPRTGRPMLEVDYETIDKLCAINCNTVEIMAYINSKGQVISEDTINRRIKKDYKMTFAEYVKQKADGTCKVALRRAQMRAVQDGNTAMIIFLSKNMLGMADKTQTEISGPSGGVIQIDSPRERIMRRIAGLSARIGAGSDSNGDDPGGSGKT